MRTGTDTSLVIPDDKITFSRTSTSSQTTRKKHTTSHRTEGIKVCTCSVSIYKVPTSLAKCKKWIYNARLGSFKKNNACFNSTYVSGQLKLGLCERRFLFCPRHVASGTESGSSMWKNITVFEKDKKIRIQIQSLCGE